MGFFFLCRMSVPCNNGKRIICNISDLHNHSVMVMLFSQMYEDVSVCDEDGC